MQRGGFDVIPIKDSDFKYTQDPDRIFWTKNVFPIAEYIIQAIQTIPWSTYTFEGSSAFWKAAVAVGYERDDFDVKIQPSTKPAYYYFGGSVFEIMNKLYDRANMPNLHSYVDPTGDLDVMLIPPQLTLPAGKSKDRYYAYFFNQLSNNSRLAQSSNRFWRPVDSTNGHLNQNNRNEPSSNTLIAEPLELQGCAADVFTGNNATREVVARDPRQYVKWIENYTDWIMDHFADNLKKYQKGGLFTLLFGNTVKFNLENDAEGRYADRVICIGNLKLVRSYLPYMNLIKIQLIAKFQGMKRSDHICEFLMEMPSSPNVSLAKFESYEHKYHVLKGFPMSNFGELVRGNLDSMINRFDLYSTVIRHKFYNHVGRMQYLHDFFRANLNPYYESDPTKLTLTKADYMDLGNYLAKFCFYIAENYFTADIFDFDYKQQFRRNLSTNQMSTLRKNILQSLIGSYPRFLLKTRDNGKYKSPFKSIAFLRGGRIPARTEFYIIDLFEAADNIPYSIRYDLKLYEDSINIIQLFMMLHFLSVLEF